jgi:Ran GTPase-activating protein (RanGAP) involved in mRNA processing and transport
LSKNVIGEEGGLALANIIAMSKTMVKCHFSYNLMGEDTAQAMMKSIHKNPRIQTLDISNNQINPRYV